MSHNLLCFFHGCNTYCSQLSKGKSTLCHFKRSTIKTIKAETENVKTSKGCVNSCCAVCIPGKNCEVKNHDWFLFLYIVIISSFSHPSRMGHSNQRVEFKGRKSPFNDLWKNTKPNLQDQQTLGLRVKF